MDAPDEVAAAVLAGGGSRRFGSDKRAAEVAGVPLLTRTVAAVAALTDDVQVVVADAADEATVRALSHPHPVRITVDGRPGEGPLAALETALAAADVELLLVVAGDHPALAPEVLALLIERALAPSAPLAVALGTDAGPQPLVAVYRRAALPALRRLLDTGERRATRALSALDAEVVAPERWAALDPGHASARDVDTPADLGGLGSLGDPPGEAIGDPPGVATSEATDRDDRTRRHAIVRVRDGAAVTTEDRVVGEDPLELRACGPGQSPRTLLTTMRTRGHDGDLAAGWLWNEGLLEPGGIDRMTVGDAVTHAQPDDQLTVHLRHPLDPEVVTHRHVAATASCGVCGRAAIAELAARAAPIPPHAPGTSVAWELLAALPDRLRDAQRLFAATGAIHATGLFDLSGRLRTLREDVGRHNALDAAIGAHVRTGALPLHELICVLSGRIGYELVAKAATAGLPVVAAVGAPSDLAVRTARRLGITLVGFLRRGDGNVYTHPDRLAW